jgi:hypothetical protein
MNAWIRFCFTAPGIFQKKEFIDFMYAQSVQLPSFRIVNPPYKVFDLQPDRHSPHKGGVQPLSK